MAEDRVREDIAFIRRAIEEGSTYATARSPDMLVWGIALSLGYLGTYGFIRGWSPVAPGVLWTACMGLPWLFSLRRLARGLAARQVLDRGPMAQGEERQFAEPPGDPDPTQPRQPEEPGAGEEPDPHDPGDDGADPAAACLAGQHRHGRERRQHDPAAEPKHRRRLRHRAAV